MSQNECGPACLAMIFRYYGLNISINKLSQACGIHRNGVTGSILKKVAEEFGFKCRAFKLTAEALFSIPEPPPLPAILYWQHNHFVVLNKIKKYYVWITDPREGYKKVSKEEFQDQYSEVLFTLEPQSLVKMEDQHLKWGYYLKHLYKLPTTIWKLIFLSLISQSVALLFPFLIQFTVDQAIVQPNGNLISVIGISIPLIILTIALVTWVRNHYLIKLQAQVSKSLSKEMVNHLLKLPLSYFELRSTGDLAARIQNITLIREILARNGASLVLDLITLITFFFAMIYQSIQLALFTLGIALGQFILMVVFIPKIRDLTRAELASQADTQSYLMESLRAIILIKANALHENVKHRWSDLFDKQIYFFSQRYKLNAILESINSSVRLSIPLLILWFGSSEVLNGSITIGSLLAFTSFATSFLFPISSLVINLQQFQLLRGVIERIEDVMQTKPEQILEESTDVSILKGPITLENVSYRYTVNDPLIVKNVSLEINPGDKIAFVGRTGSGKTTLSRLILGLYHPTEGKIQFNHQDSTKLNHYILRGKMGIVLQDTFLFNDTIANNIACYKKVSFEDIKRAAISAELHEDILQMPMGYNTLIGENGENLSGGQRQKLAIARAIVNNPYLLILDEATSHLDPITERKIDNYLRHAKVTRIVIAHRLTSIMDSNKIFVLDRGEIVESGTHEELLQLNGIYARMWNDQNSKLNKEEYSVK